MPNHQTSGCTGEPAVCHQTDFVAESFTVQSAGNCEHFAHTGTTSWTFIPNDDDVAGLDLTLEDRLHRIFFAFKDTRRPLELYIVYTRYFHDAAFRRQIAL